jgi:hypothetical protein
MHPYRYFIIVPDKKFYYLFNTVLVRLWVLTRGVEVEMAGDIVSLLLGRPEARIGGLDPLLVTAAVAAAGPPATAVAAAGYQRHVVRQVTHKRAVGARLPMLAHHLPHIGYNFIN